MNSCHHISCLAWALGIERMDKFLWDPRGWLPVVSFSRGHPIHVRSLSNERLLYERLNRQGSRTIWPVKERLVHESEMSTGPTIAF